MTYTYIKTSNLIEFYAAKNDLESRGLVYVGGNVPDGLNVIKIDSMGMFGICGLLEWINQDEINE